MNVTFKQVLEIKSYFVVEDDIFKYKFSPNLLNSRVSTMPFFMQHIHAWARH